jgi:3'-phosphoadenosine 5'-phosphosulfate sulfotransferase (PAPS reductase)/FAD synthetase
MFSGGAASSVVAKMIADKYPNDTILLHTPTGAEHPDADRFRDQVAKFIGLPITIESHKRTLWDLVESYKQIPNDGLPYCTQKMKLIPQDRFLKRFEKQNQDFIQYLGLGVDEWGRMQKVWARNQQKERKVEFPLLDARLTGDDCQKIIREEWKICLPQPYQYLSHNNCIPCYKGGKSHWYKVWKHYRAEFDRSANAERDASNTVFNGVSLDELSEKWTNEPEQMDLFGDMEGIPCMCAL